MVVLLNLVIEFVRSPLGLLASALLIGHASISSAADTAPTPAQPKGPFYPRKLPAERDSDLASVAGKAAQGEVIAVMGRIYDRGGKPVPGARVEIWQTNAEGRYHHERDDSAAPWDPGFQGWGETQTGAEGGYRFRTIKPVAYSGRAPHIHFAVTAPGKPTFYTQLYLADASENARDFLIRELAEAERARLMVALEPRSGSAGDPTVRFDIVLP